MKLSCNLFGNTEIKIDDIKINFPFKKAEGLFYYMLIEKEASRDLLVNLLWSENTEESAKKNLRNAIYMIKKTFGFEILYSPVRAQIVLNKDTDIDIDVDSFLSGNVEAYSGEFLSDFFVKDAENYETWQINLREHFKDKYISSLYEKLNNETDENTIESYCKSKLGI